MIASHIRLDRVAGEARAVPGRGTERTRITGPPAGYGTITKTLLFDGAESDFRDPIEVSLWPI
ncbi:hypothetical protein BRC77_02905 [Halobacteriales archaeon QH_8_64_26]|nr:MAG: hypothetical protein BRC77_02905 [Halobacteriales archaeon QH_8_64_26]